MTVNTVAENHGGNKRLLRARLHAGWTFVAKVFFWSVVSFVALVIFITQHTAPHPWWVFLAWLLVAIAVGYLHLRARRTIRLGIALLDLTAQEMKLIKLDAPRKFVKPD